MKKLLVVVLVAFALGAAPLWAEGIGLDVGLEIGTGDLLDKDADFSLYLLPSVGYAFGETGLYAGACWYLPVAPEFSKGVPEAYIEYAFSAAGLDFTLGVDLTYDLDAADDALGSYVYGIVGYGLPCGLSFGAELDFTYLPAVALDALVGAYYERALGPGTFGVGVDQNFALYDAAGIGDTEFYVNYSLPAGPVELTFEVDPVLTTGAPDVALQLYALVSVGYSF